MPTYEITAVEHVELVFLIEAADAADAEERYLREGDETETETLYVEVRKIRLRNEPIPGPPEQEP